MAKRVTEKYIIDINEAYLLCKTYSAVLTAVVAVSESLYIEAADAFFKIF